MGRASVAHEVDVVGMDIVEVSPPYDVGNNITALLAHRFVFEALTGVAMSRAGIDEPNYLDARAAGVIGGARHRRRPGAPQTSKRKSSASRLPSSRGDRGPWWWLELPQRWR